MSSAKPVVETEGSVLEAIAGAAPRRVGAAEMIATTLRDQILAGKLRPGDSLPEVEVAAAFGVARNTVREALKVLARSGLAVHEVHHGVSVRRLTTDDVDQLFGLRAILEFTACDRAGSLNTDEIERLAAPVEEGETALENSDVWGVTTANQAFHRAIVALLANPRIEAAHESVLAELTLGLMLEERNAETAAMWLARNRELFELFKSGTPAACRKVLRSYLDDSRTNLLGYVRPAMRRSPTSPRRAAASSTARMRRTSPSA